MDPVKYAIKIYIEKKKRAKNNDIVYYLQGDKTFSRIIILYTFTRTAIVRPGLYCVF